MNTTTEPQLDAIQAFARDNIDAWLLLTTQQRTDLVSAFRELVRENQMLKLQLMKGNTFTVTGNSDVSARSFAAVLKGQQP